MIIEQKKQLFGTNWTLGEDGVPFLIPVRDFKNVNNRRAMYMLGPIKRPVDLAVGANKYPLGKGIARESDQKGMSAIEHERYTSIYLREV